MLPTYSPDALQTALGNRKEEETFGEASLTQSRVRQNSEWLPSPSEMSTFKSAEAVGIALGDKRDLASVAK